MHVTFKSAQKLGNKPFKVVAQMVPDHLASNQKFQQLVKSGEVIVHAKSEGEIAIQAFKDEQNIRKAMIAKQMTDKMNAAKAAGANPVEIANLAKAK